MDGIFIESAQERPGNTTKYYKMTKMLLLLLLCSSSDKFFNVVYFIDYENLGDSIYTCPNCGFLKESSKPKGLQI